MLLTGFSCPSLRSFSEAMMISVYPSSFEAFRGQGVDLFPHLSELDLLISMFSRYLLAKGVIFDDFSLLMLIRTVKFFSCFYLPFPDASSIDS